MDTAVCVQAGLCPGLSESETRPLPHPQVTLQPERMVSVPGICLPLNFSKIQEIISEASLVSLELNSLVLRNIQYILFYYYLC